jgi:Protein of unknown function (DUF1549)/Protein of unknown function (DUF1553)
MKQPRWSIFSVAVLAGSGLLIGQTPDSPAKNPDQLTVSHAECDYFGAQRERYADAALRAASHTHALGNLTGRVSAMLAPAGGGGRTRFGQTHTSASSIDSYIQADFTAHNITPAPITTDWEFIRRVTLDLTGRIPAPDRVLSFVGDSSLDKRAKLIDELLAKPEWVDKWTMYFGDLYQNTATKTSTSLQRFPQGRNAFYQWIHDSLAAGKPYDQMATELIATASDNSYTNGPVNFLLNGFITGGPNQDIMDQATSFVFGTFLGITHVNCLLCHNGAGHLDSLSLWGKSTTRYQAWQLASYLSHTQLARTTVSNNVYYWSVLDNTKGFTTDYALNTTTGNRPARVAPSGCKAGQPCFTVAPQYIFTGDTPNPGEPYRTALARHVTGDFQFARASVNYIWAQLFGRGIVDPPDTFDPARLDPDKPPPAPWTLQPTNPALLNALAQHFVASGYDLKALMREIANSQTYQLSSRYDDTWNSAWEPYFARKFVRRLWAEEVHDAVAQSSRTLPAYTVTGFSDLGFGNVTYAMQLPDVVNLPDRGGSISQFLDSFLRGNRDDQARKQDGSILQALNLMNNAYVVNRSHASGSTLSQLISQNLTKSNTDLINTLFLSILSRYPTSDEMAKVLASFPASGANRTTAAQDLVWSLYNKVDFVFNY